MTIDKSLDEEIIEIQANCPDHKIPTDFAELFQIVVDAEIIVKEFHAVPEFKILFKYWYHIFKGDADLIFGASAQLNTCACLIKAFGTESPRVLKETLEYLAKKNYSYLEAHEHLKKASELLDVPMRMLTLTSCFPASLENPNERIILPRIPAIRRMLEAVESQELFLMLSSGVTPNRTTITTWAIRYLWKNISIEPQHVIDGHPLLGERWKLIGITIGLFGRFRNGPRYSPTVTYSKSSDPNCAKSKTSSHQRQRVG